MKASLVIGHGSLHDASGAAMIRLAARLENQHGVQLTGAGFLNFSEPDFATALQRLIDKGASEIIVLPYFLVPGYFVRVSLAQKVAAAQAHHPQLRISLAEPLGDHPAMAELIVKRAQQAAPIDETQQALLILVHGSPRPESNAPIYKLVQHIRAKHTYVLVRICYMEHNQPSIAEAITEASTYAQQIIAVPYFLQHGSHVREDLPEAIQAGRNLFPDHSIILANYLGFDEFLVDVLATRVAE